MPGETTSEVTEQQVSTVEEDVPKQSRSDLPDNDDEPTPSSSSVLRTVLTNGLKRRLPDGVDSDKKKKIRLTEVSEDELEIIDKEQRGKNHTELLIQKVSESLANTIGTPTVDKKSNVSNKTHDNLNNETNPSFNMINHNGNNGIDDKDCEEDCPDKNTLSKDISKDRENKTSNINNVNNSCKFIGNSKDAVKNDKNILTKNDIPTRNGISCLNKSSSSDNLPIAETTDQVTENISTAVNDSTVRESNLNHSNTKISTIENIINSIKNYEFQNKIQNLTKNTDETKSIESPCNTNSNTNNSKKVSCSNGIDQNVEAMDSDNSCDIASYDLTDLSDLSEDIRNIISGVQQITKESFPQLLQLFSSKDVTFDQFNSMCAQKVVEVMTEKGFVGKHRTHLQLWKEKERFWRTKYFLLDRQLKETISAISLQQRELKTNENARPRKVTRTVGLQAVLSTRKEGSMKLPKQAIPLAKPNPQMPPLVTTSKSLVVSPKKVTASPKNVTASPKNVTTSPKNVTASPKDVTATPKNVTASPKDVTATPKNVTASPKTVPTAKSSNPINIGTTPTTIDLTENDDIIEESNIINLENTTSPIKILQRSSASILPVGTVMNGNAKSYTFVELPNNPSSSSSFIMKTASRSPQKTIVSNKDTINTSPKSKNLNPILINVSRVDPVLVQPCTVTYTAHRVPVSQISGTLQPMSTASYTPRQITVSQLSASLKKLTPCQLPVSCISGSVPGIALPSATPGTSFSTCRLPISLRTIPHTGYQSTKKPPPPAIPLSSGVWKHPSPVPGIPNQKSLSTWKRLPPAPNLSINRPEAHDMPQALSLCWTMNINKTIAEVIRYQIYAYQEHPNQPPNINLWKKVGEVNALPLPMSCSLTHFSNGQKYHFLVRAVDVYTRVGPFSSPKST